MKYVSGIYKIKNILNNNFYIGQSVKLNLRKTMHFSKLKNKKHTNKYLQNTYNKYGKNNFVFEIVLYCEPKELIYYEQFLVNLWNPKYNICKKCVNSPLGIKRSRKTKKKISKNHADFRGEKSGMFGRRYFHSFETIQKMKENRNKLSNMCTKQYVLQILEMIYTNASNYDICMRFYISDSTINKIKRNGYEDAYGIVYDKSKVSSPLEKKRKLLFAKDISRPNILKKEIVLQVKNMLNNNMSVKEITSDLCISDATVRRVKFSYYDKIYGL